jgi:hypothetical protein
MMAPHVVAFELGPALDLNTQENLRRASLRAGHTEGRRSAQLDFPRLMPEREGARQCDRFCSIAWMPRTDSPPAENAFYG